MSDGAIRECHVAEGAEGGRELYSGGIQCEANGSNGEDDGGLGSDGGKEDARRRRKRRSL